MNASLPQRAMLFAFTPESALDRVGADGLSGSKSSQWVGSWGRLLAKINDRDAARPSSNTKAMPVRHNNQVFIFRSILKSRTRYPRGGHRWARVDRECIAHRLHWITNTARGGEGELCPVTRRIEICV